MAAMRPSWLLAVLCGGLVACATTPPLSPADGCEHGSAWACDEWAGQLRGQGERQGADAAYGRACGEGIIHSCLEQGRMRLEDGDLAGAEPPLLRAYEANVEDGALALADLNESRGDLETAARLRREAPALDKPATEFVFAYRMDLRGRLAPELSLNIQPLALFERRMSFGANMAFSSRQSLVEVNGFVAYQHFESSWLVPYGKLLVGGGSGLNLGGEVGTKLCFAGIGHLNVAAGASRASGGYVSLGMGLDGLIVLIAALHAL